MKKATSIDWKMGRVFMCKVDFLYVSVCICMVTKYLSFKLMEDTFICNGKDVGLCFKIRGENAVSVF